MTYTSAEAAKPLIFLSGTNAFAYITMLFFYGMI